MSDIHFILQGKGGVGKSLISTILAEYCISKDRAAHCIDCDAINPTFSSFKYLNAHHLEILKEGTINSRNFDDLIQIINDSKDDRPFIIDNGSSGFLPICDYLLSNQIFPLLQEMGHDVYIHTILAGGEHLSETLRGFVGLANNFKDVPLIIWKNDFFGSLVINGKPIESHTLFTENLTCVYAQIHLPKPQAQTFGEDLIDLRRKNLTLTEGINSEKVQLMMRHRIKVLQGIYFEALSLAQL